MKNYELEAVSKATQARKASQANPLMRKKRNPNQPAAFNRFFHFAFMKRKYAIRGYYSFVLTTSKSSLSKMAAGEMTISSVGIESP